MKPGLVLAGSVSGAGAWWSARHSRAPAVKRWRPSALPGGRVGSLHVRRGGETGPVVVLLHGLVASGDIFGAAFDPLVEAATLVVPDLLGFGRSLDETRTSLTPDDHLDALDEMLDQLGLAQRPLVLGAHSMGGSIALRWAMRRGPQIRRVICWGAPIYPGEHSIDGALAAEGFMTRLFVANTTWARVACRVNCAHRTMAGFVAAAVTPSLPIPVARAASLHTWPAYRDAMDHLVAGTDWPALMQAATANGTTVELVWGSDDRVGDRHYAQKLTATAIDLVPDAGHHLPITHGDRCREQLDPAAAMRSHERRGSGPGDTPVDR